MKQAAKLWVTGVCCATYFNPGSQDTPAEDTSAANYAANAGNPTAQATIVASYVDTTAVGPHGAALPNLLTKYTNWKAWAIGHGVNFMTAYEGGWSPDLDDHATAQINDLRFASKFSPNLAAYATTNMNNFTGLTGGGFVAAYPSHYYLSRISATQYGASKGRAVWSLWDDIYETPSTQWSAIVAFNH